MPDNNFETDMHDVIVVAQDSMRIDGRVLKTIDGGVPIAILREGEQVATLEEAMEAADRRADAPQRRSGVTLHSELASFIAHLKRYAEKHTTVWADTDATRLVAVYNDHPAGSDPKKAGWSDHRAVYEAPRSPEWSLWTQNADRMMSSEDFAEFIESRIEDLTSTEGCASPVELLETARNMQIHTKGTFVKMVNPDTGEYHMVAQEEHDKKTSTRIPKRFTLALRVFEGGDQYRVEARIRFKIVHGSPQFSYSLKRHQEILRDAFGDVRTKVVEETKLPVFAGHHGRQ